MGLLSKAYAVAKAPYDSQAQMSVGLLRKLSWYDRLARCGATHCPR